MFGTDNNRKKSLSIQDLRRDTRNLESKFESCFQDFKLLQFRSNLFSASFNADGSTLADEFQLELIDLQRSTELSAKFGTMELS